MKLPVHKNLNAPSEKILTHFRVYSAFNEFIDSSALRKPGIITLLWIGKCLCFSFFLHYVLEIYLKISKIQLFFISKFTYFFEVVLKTGHHFVEDKLLLKYWSIYDAMNSIKHGLSFLWRYLATKFGTINVFCISMPCGEQ